MPAFPQLSPWSFSRAPQSTRLPPIAPPTDDQQLFAHLGLKPGEVDLQGPQVPDTPRAAMVNQLPQPTTPSAPLPGATPMEAGSGLNASNTGSTNERQRLLETHSTMPSAGELMDFSSSYNALPEVSSQRANQANLRDIFAMQAQEPSQLDLSPLAGLTDAWSGSNLAKTYTKPEGLAAHRDKLLAYAEKLQGNDKDITKNMIDAFKSMKSGMYTQEQIQAAANVIKQGAEDPNKFKDKGRAGSLSDLRIKEADIRKSTADLQGKVSQTKSDFSNIAEALASNDYQKVSTMISTISKNIGKEAGMLSEGDIKRVVPSNFNGDVAKFLAYFNDTPTSQYDPAYTKSLRELVSTSQKNMSQKFKEMSVSRKAGYKASKSFSDIPVDTHFSDLDKTISDFGSVPTPAAPAPSANEAKRTELNDRMKRIEDALNRAEGKK